MLRLLLIVPILCGMVRNSSRCKSTSSEEKKSLKAIDELHCKDLQAAKAGDFETLLSLWTEDGVLLEPGKNPIIGKEAIRAYMEEQSQLSMTLKISKYDHRWEEIQVHDDWAFEWGFFETEAELNESGEIIKQKGKLMRILKKQKDGSWKCARAIYHNDSSLDNK